MRLLLHALEPRVVIRELVQVRERDLARRVGIIAGDIREAVVQAVLELHVHPGPELLDIEGRVLPVDADVAPDPSGLLGGEALLSHRQRSPGTAGTCWVMQWMLPPPSRISRARHPTTSRSGEAAGEDLGRLLVVALVEQREHDAAGGDVEVGVGGGEAVAGAARLGAGDRVARPAPPPR